MVGALVTLRSGNGHVLGTRGQSGNLEGLPDSGLRNIIIISVIVLFLLLPTNSS